MRIIDNTKHGYKSCKKKYDSCNKFVDEGTAIKCFSVGKLFEIKLKYLFK